MISINGLSLTPGVKHWLANAHFPQILHIFKEACNLMDERGEVLSVVTPPIGNGPFNLVIEDDILFSEHLDTASSVTVLNNQLHLGNLTIQLAEATLWQPDPNWNKLYSNKNTILDSIANIGLRYDKTLPNVALLTYIPFGESQSLGSDFSKEVANANVTSACKLASKLAGLGPGLTPAGDDFLMGAMYAARIIHPQKVAAALVREIADVTAPLTTSLSAAWLRSAGRGEAGCLWHEFFEELLAEDLARIRVTLEKILAVGATSGADALVGFLSTMMGLRDGFMLKNVRLPS